MLKLSLEARTVTIDLAPGVVVYARTLTSIDVIAAETEAARLMKAALEGEAVTEMMGFGMVIEGPDLSDAKVRAAWTAFVTEVLLVEQVIEGWDGIGDAAGNVVDPDRQTIAWLLQDPGHRRRVRAAIEEPLLQVEQEAKKSRPAVAGK